MGVEFRRRTFRNIVVSSYKTRSVADACRKPCHIPPSNSFRKREIWLDRPDILQACQHDRTRRKPQETRLNKPSSSRPHLCICWAHLYTNAGIMRAPRGSRAGPKTVAFVSLTQTQSCLPKTTPPVLLRGGRTRRPSPLDMEDPDDSGLLTERSFSDDDRDPPIEDTDHVPEVPGVRRL